MLSLSLPAGEPLKVLCLGAHCDDIEIGCGGTLMSFRSAIPSSAFEWVVFTGEDGARAGDAQGGGRDPPARRGAEVEVLNFRMSYLPFDGAEIKDHFESLKAARPAGPDPHAPARGPAPGPPLVAELTWNTFRDHLVARIRDPEIRRRSRPPESLRAARATTMWREARHADGVLPVPATRAWFSRDLFRGAPAPARHRVQRALGPRRGVPCAQARCFNAPRSHAMGQPADAAGSSCSRTTSRRSAPTSTPSSPRMAGGRAADHRRRRLPRLLPVQAALHWNRTRAAARRDRRHGLRQLHARRAGLARGAARRARPRPSCGRT